MVKAKGVTQLLREKHDWMEFSRGFLTKRPIGTWVGYPRAELNLDPTCNLGNTLYERNLNRKIPNKMDV